MRHSHVPLGGMSLTCFMRWWVRARGRFSPALQNLPFSVGHEAWHGPTLGVSPENRPISQTLWDRQNWGGGGTWCGLDRRQKGAPEPLCVCLLESRCSACFGGGSVLICFWALMPIPGTQGRIETEEHRGGTTGGVHSKGYIMGKRGKASPSLQ